MPPEVLERVGTPSSPPASRERVWGGDARAAFTQHGGSLEYRSEEGRGTVVVGVLPLQQKRVTLGALLLVDDEPGMLFALKELTKQRRHEVVLARSGRRRSRTSRRRCGVTDYAIRR